MAGLPPLLHLAKCEADRIEEHEGDRSDQVDVLEVLRIRAAIQSIDWKCRDRQTERQTGVYLCLNYSWIRSNIGVGVSPIGYPKAKSLL